MTRHDMTRHDTTRHGPEYVSKVTGVTNVQLNAASSFITSIMCGSGTDLYTGSSKGPSNKL